MCWQGGGALGKELKSFDTRKKLRSCDKNYRFGRFRHRLGIIECLILCDKSMAH